MVLFDQFGLGHDRGSSHGVVGGGCSGHALKFGPLLGEFLADLALGQDIPLPRERFASQRPSLPAL